MGFAASLLVYKMNAAAKYLYICGGFNLSFTSEVLNARSGLAVQKSEVELCLMLDASIYTSWGISKGTCTENKNQGEVLHPQSFTCCACVFVCVYNYILLYYIFLHPLFFSKSFVTICHKNLQQ